MATSVLPPLRPYQREAIAAQRHRQLTVLPTGTGKTRIISELAVRRPTLIVVHREELLDQTVRAVRAVDPRARVGVVQGPRWEWRDVTIAMQQTLRGKVSRDSRFGPTAFQQLLVDEAHRYTTEKSGRIVLDALEKTGASVYGFTATPQIHGRPVYGPGMPWTGIAYRRSVVSMIREGYLCDVRGLSLAMKDLDLRKVKRSGGDYTAKSLGQAMLRCAAPERIAGAWAEHAGERQRTLVFVPTVELGRETARAFREAGATTTREVYGSTPAAERRRTVDAFRRGDCHVLVNVLVGAEGFDVPEVDCIVQARPTRSWTLYVQCVGRGLRPAPGKTDLLVLDVAGSAAEHDLATLPKAVELPGMRKGKSARECVEGRSEREIELETGRAALEEVLLYTPVHWSAWGDERIAVVDGDRVCVLAPVEPESPEEPLGWGVFACDVRSGRETELGHFDYPADAQEFAEDWIREEGDGKLFKRSARWRREAPTAAQARWFRGGSMPATRGEASEAITLAFYRRTRSA